MTSFYLVGTIKSLGGLSVVNMHFVWKHHIIFIIIVDVYNTIEPGYRLWKVRQILNPYTKVTGCLTVTKDLCGGYL